MSQIEFNQVTFAYQQEPILKDLTLQVETNSFWTIVGPNGSGKSTFLNLLAGLLKPQQGTIRIEGKKVSDFNSRSLARLLAMVRQEFVPAFEYTVEEIVMMARYSQRSSLFENDQDRQITDKALQDTDILQFAQRPLGSLSGGERQRVFIARALAQETPILLLDEPTSHLDIKHQIRIYDLLKKMQAEQSKTILMITHDLNLAAQYSDKVILMASGGTSVQGDPSEVINIERIQSFFGVKGYHGTLKKEKFFIPLGDFSKDSPP